MLCIVVWFHNDSFRFVSPYASVCIPCMCLLLSAQVMYTIFGGWHLETLTFAMRSIWFRLRMAGLQSRTSTALTRKGIFIKCVYVRLIVFRMSRCLSWSLSNLLRASRFSLLYVGILYFVGEVWRGFRAYCLIVRAATSEYAARDHAGTSERERESLSHI